MEDPPHDLKQQPQFGNNYTVQVYFPRGNEYLPIKGG